MARVNYLVTILSLAQGKAVFLDNSLSGLALGAIPVKQTQPSSHYINNWGSVIKNRACFITS